jgi:hypothetical protein
MRSRGPMLAISPLPARSLAAMATRYALPVFSWRIASSWSTCHLDFTKLGLGKTFKDAGYKFLRGSPV